MRAANALFERILKFQTRKGEIYVKNNGFIEKKTQLRWAYPDDDEAL